VRGVTVGGVSTSGLVLSVDVDVKNPNSIALPVTDADYSLSLGGVKVIDGAKIKPEGSIPANGSRVITVPVPLTFEGLLMAEEGIRKGGGSVKYGLEAALYVDTGVPLVGKMRVPFSHEGSLNVRELVQKNWSTILTSPAARKLAEKALGMGLGIFGK